MIFKKKNTLSAVLLEKQLKFVFSFLTMIIAAQDVTLARAVYVIIIRFFIQSFNAIKYVDSHMRVYSN